MCHRRSADIIYRIELSKLFEINFRGHAIMYTGSRLLKDNNPAPNLVVYSVDDERADC
jgi:hypothetical protein